jgi:hypothetical protein
MASALEMGRKRPPSTAMAATTAMPSSVHLMSRSAMQGTGTRTKHMSRCTPCTSSANREFYANSQNRYSGDGWEADGKGPRMGLHGHLARRSKPVLLRIDSDHNQMSLALAATASSSVQSLLTSVWSMGPSHSRGAHTPAVSTSTLPMARSRVQKTSVAILLPRA